MKIKMFSIVEMIVVISIICILIALAFPYFPIVHNNSQGATTKNMLKQQASMISAYYDTYHVLPLSMHANPNLYNDTTAIKYWERVPTGLYSTNTIPTGLLKNAELRFDPYNNEGGSSSTLAQFNAKYPSKDLVIPLSPWYNGVSTAANLEQEEMNVITHSSRFLNYYLSGSGFDIQRESFHKQEEKWLANYDTTYRLSYDRSALVRPFLYFLTDNTFFWNGASPETKLTKIPPYTSFVFNQTFIYFDYIPKIIGDFNSQSYSKNLNEDKLRRLYDFHEDKNPDGTKKPLPILKNKYDKKTVTLKTDKIMFNGNFLTSSSQRDARAQKTNATNQLNNANAQLAAAVTPAEIAAANVVIANANTANAAADQALKDATPGDLNNSNSAVYMRAHAENVKCIVDAFNSPIVYITYTNQRKEFAKTYSYVDDLTLIPDLSKDKSMRADTFILYSLGANKADDSNLGENYRAKLGTGDDLFEVAGEN
jgi:type II secretory pathway pseudopilin PulG